jgi:hypothetical protein
MDNLWKKLPRKYGLLSVPKPLHKWRETMKGAMVDVGLKRTAVSAVPLLGVNLVRILSK